MPAVPVEMDKQEGGDNSSQANLPTNTTEASDPPQEGGGNSSQANLLTNTTESSDPPPIGSSLPYPPYHGVVAGLEPDGDRICPKTSAGSTAKIIRSVRSSFISSNCYYRRGKFWSTSAVVNLTGKPKQYYRRGKFWPV